jgi:hypothetical protein
VAQNKPMCRLITKTKLRAPKNQTSAATLDELEEHADGLVCLTGDEDGPLAAALRTGGISQARQLLERLRSRVHPTCLDIPRSSAGINHGGAGTLAVALRDRHPSIVYARRGGSTVLGKTARTTRASSFRS